MKIIVTGATGTAGQEVVRQAILDNEVAEIIAVSRKPVMLNSPKIRQILHQDFMSYDSLLDEFSGADAFIWCLGISQSQVSKTAYEQITFDFTLAAAQAWYASNKNGTFVFLSGAGADTTEKSRTLFARIKGKAENELHRINGLKLIIARPAGIKPIHKNPNMAFLYKIFLPIFPLLEWLTPDHVIASDILAKALLKLAKAGSEQPLVENKELQILGGKIG